MTGFDASTSGKGTNNLEPLLLKIQTPAVLPNDIKANLAGCFVIAEAVGRLDKERADVRLVSLSCLSNEGKAIIDTQVKGFVTDSDSKVGLSRYLAGEIEVELKEFFTDRTHWQKMLRNEVLPAADFQEAYNRAQTSLTVELRKYLCSNDSVFTSRFPVLQYPSKIISFNPEKSPYIEGVLTGIKGQYLMFDAEKVINIRKFEGYEVVIT